MIDLCIAHLFLLSHTMDPSHNVCDECGSCKLIICWRQGELTCSVCGLVKQTHLLDDTYYGNMPFVDKEQHVAYPDTVVGQTCRYSGVIKEAVERILPSQNNYELVKFASRLFNAVCQDKLTDFRGKNKRAAMAASVYCAAKHLKYGVAVEAVYAIFEVDLWLNFSKICQVWKRYPEYAGILEQDHDDTLMRMIYKNHHIPTEMIACVRRIALCLKERVVSHLSSHTKSEKLNACFIYIACIQAKVKVTHKQFHALYHVTSSTLTKHEAMIQDVLISHGEIM